MPAEALASCDMAWIFALIFLRSRSTFERFPSASERLPPAFCWIATTIPKKLASGSGVRFHDHPEFRAQRLRSLQGNHSDAIEEREAGLDAAHDDVDCIRKGFQEL